MNGQMSLADYTRPEQSGSLCGVYRLDPLPLQFMNMEEMETRLGNFVATKFTPLARKAHRACQNQQISSQWLNDLQEEAHLDRTLSYAVIYISRTLFADSVTYAYQQSTDWDKIIGVQS